MKSLDVIEAEKRAKEEAEAAKKADQAAKDDAATAEIIEREAANSTPEDNGGPGERLFTQEQVNKIVRERLAKERAKGEPSAEDVRAAEMAREEMMLKFRADLTDYGLPAENIIRTFQGLDLNSPEGLRHAVDDIIGLNDVITEYAAALEAAQAAREAMPKPEKADVLRKIFGLE